MTYEEFRDQLIEEFCEHTSVPQEEFHFLPDGWTGSGSVQDLELIQDTNARYHKESADHVIGDYIVIKKDDATYTNQCRFSVEDLFGEYTKKGMDAVWGHVDEALAIVNKLNLEDVFGENAKYELVKNRFIIRAVNHRNHYASLKEKVFRQFGDIALALYVLASDEGGTLTTSKVPKIVLDRWGVDEDTAFEEALLNTYLTRPPRLYKDPFEAINPPYTKGAFMALGYKEDFKNPGRFSVPVVTTYPNVNGAVALFYPGVKEKLAEIMGGSYYIAFTSIHEAMLHSVSMLRPRDIRDGIRNTNRNMGREEMLTDKVYLFDGREMREV